MISNGQVLFVCPLDGTAERRDALRRSAPCDAPDGPPDARGGYLAGRVFAALRFVGRYLTMRACAAWSANHY